MRYIISLFPKRKTRVIEVEIIKIIKFMKTDKKNNSDKIKLILLKKMGQTILNQEYSVKNLNGFLKNELID